MERMIERVVDYLFGLLVIFLLMWGACSLPEGYDVLFIIVFGGLLFTLAVGNKED